jgi:hypothetical protein
MGKKSKKNKAEKEDTQETTNLVVIEQEDNVMEEDTPVGIETRQ